MRGIVPVAVGADGEPALIGYTTLEILELKPNPSKRSLEPARRNIRDPYRTLEVWRYLPVLDGAASNVRHAEARHGHADRDDGIDQDDQHGLRYGSLNGRAKLQER